jgi:hypothetical protein
MGPGRKEFPHPPQPDGRRLGKRSRAASIDTLYTYLAFEAIVCRLAYGMVWCGARGNVCATMPWLSFPFTLARLGLVSVVLLAYLAVFTDWVVGPPKIDKLIYSAGGITFESEDTITHY